MNTRRSLVVLAGCAVTALACQAIVGIEDDRFTVAPAEAGEPDAAAGEGGAVDLCPHAYPPRAPAAADGPNQPELVFALRDASIRGRNDAGAVVGYDLDNACTCDPRDGLRGSLSACVAPTGRTREEECDPEGGIDNWSVTAFDRLSSALAVAGVNPIEDEISRQARCGAQTILLYVSQYNWLADDPEVFVVLLPSFGLRDGGEVGDEGGGGCPDRDPSTGPFIAHGDMRDAWSITPNDETFRQRVIRGWVRDYTLVVDTRSVGTGVLPFVLGAEILTVTAPVLTARLVPLDERGNDIVSPDGVTPPASFRFEDAILAGRARADDILSSIGKLRIGSALGGGDPHLCKRTFEYGIAKGAVCGGLDLVTPLEREFQGDPCNAASLVLQFSGYRASLGAARYESPSVTGGSCAGFTDSCSTDTAGADAGN